MSKELYDNIVYHKYYLTNDVIDDITLDIINICINKYTDKDLYDILYKINFSKSSSRAIDQSNNKVKCV